MLELTKDTRQFVLKHGEDGALRMELERAFVKLDKETAGGQYSMSNMRIKYPALVELFHCLRGM